MRSITLAGVSVPASSHSGTFSGTIYRVESTDFHVLTRLQQLAHDGRTHWQDVDRGKSSAGKNWAPSIDSVKETLAARTLWSSCLKSHVTKMHLKTWIASSTTARRGASKSKAVTQAKTFAYRNSAAGPVSFGLTNLCTRRPLFGRLPTSSLSWEATASRRQNHHQNQMTRTWSRENMSTREIQTWRAKNHLT